MAVNRLYPGKSDGKVDTYPCELNVQRISLYREKWMERIVPNLYGWNFFVIITFFYDNHYGDLQNSLKWKHFW